MAANFLSSFLSAPPGRMASMGMRPQGFTLGYCLSFPPGRKSDATIPQWPDRYDAELSHNLTFLRQILATLRVPRAANIWCGFVQ